MTTNLLIFFTEKSFGPIVSARGREINTNEGGRIVNFCMLGGEVGHLEVEMGEGRDRGGGEEVDKGSFVRWVGRGCEREIAEFGEGGGGS